MDAVAKKPYHTIGRWGHGQVKTATLNKKQLDCLYVLFGHRTLPSDVIKALAAPGATHRSVADNLFVLRHKPNGHVACPRIQRDAANSDYANMVYELTEKGAQALLDHGRITYRQYRLWIATGTQYRRQHFNHSLATGYLTASIELGCREKSYVYLSWFDILDRDRCPQETKESANPLGIAIDGKILTPDAIFGIEYGNGAYFFAIETDMGTEQIEESRSNVSITQKIKNYREILHKQTFRERFALPSLQVMFVTTSIIRMHNMMDKVVAIGSKDGKGSTRPFLFKAIPQLAHRTRDPLPPTGHLLTEPWSLAHGKTLSLTQESQAAG